MPSDSRPLGKRDAVPDQKTAILIALAIFQAQIKTDLGDLRIASKDYTAEQKSTANYGDFWDVHIRQEVIDSVVKNDRLLTYFIAIIGKRDGRLWEFRLEQ